MLPAAAAAAAVESLPGSPPGQASVSSHDATHVRSQSNVSASSTESSCSASTTASPGAPPAKSEPLLCTPLQLSAFERLVVSGGLSGALAATPARELRAIVDASRTQSQHVETASMVLQSVALVHVVLVQIASHLLEIAAATAGYTAEGRVGAAIARIDQGAPLSESSSKQTSASGLVLLAASPIARDRMEQLGTRGRLARRAGVHERAHLAGYARRC
jgi:hypothetical protein